MRRFKADETGWEKIGKKHFRHESGIEVKYDCMAWKWEIIGGPEDGYAYGTKWAAYWIATKHLTPATV